MWDGWIDWELDKRRRRSACNNKEDVAAEDSEGGEIDFDPPWAYQLKDTYNIRECWKPMVDEILKNDHY